MDTPILLRREDIAAALKAADADALVPPAAYYARRLEFKPPGTTCLAYDADSPTDYGLFVTVVGALVGDVLEFAHAAQAIPFSRDNTVTWPNIILAEATAGDWDDARAEDEDRTELRAAVDAIADQAAVEGALAGAR